MTQALFDMLASIRLEQFYLQLVSKGFASIESLLLITVDTLNTIGMNWAQKKILQSHLQQQAECILNKEGKKGKGSISYLIAGPPANSSIPYFPLSHQDHSCSAPFFIPNQLDSHIPYHSSSSIMSCAPNGSMAYSSLFSYPSSSYPNVPPDYSRAPPSSQLMIGENLTTSTNTSTTRNKYGGTGHSINGCNCYNEGSLCSGNIHHHPNQHQHCHVNSSIQPKKRCYRKHPKPDFFCPKQPLSAYQIFSLRVRSELKDKNTLSFVEIARLVGQKWQVLPKEEKEKIQTEARIAKNKYLLSYEEYKKTKHYQDYQQYLKEFEQNLLLSGRPPLPKRGRKPQKFSEPVFESFNKT